MQKLLHEEKEEQETSSFNLELDEDSAQNATREPNALERLIMSFRHLFLKPIRKPIIVLYVIAFVDSFSYYAFTYSLVQHLGLELGLSDQTSYWFYGIFGISISLSSLIFGFFIDRLGPRASICISATVSFVARMALAYSVLFNAVWLTGVILFGLVAPSIALISPPVPIALKRYTNSRSRDTGMSLYYGIMNAAAFAVTPLVDMWRISGRDSTLWLPPYALVIAMTSVLQIPIMLLALIGLKNVKMTEQDTVEHVVVANGAGGPRKTFKQQLYAMFSNRSFWKAFVLLACLVGAKSTFRYMDALYLTYVVRAFPDGRTQHYLTLLAINPLMVIVFTVTGLNVLLTSRFNPIAAITIGVGIGGAAPFFLTFGPFLWTLVMYIVVTTVGEIIWAPVVMTYLANVATEGSEGAWMALAGLPMFLSKLMTGGLTGTLTSIYCPDPSLLCPAQDTAGDFKPRCWKDPVECGVEYYFSGKRGGGGEPRFDPSTDCRYVNGTLVDTPAPSAPVLWGDPRQCYSLALWGIIGATTITSFVALCVLYCWLKSPSATSSKYEEVYEEEKEEKSAVSMVRRNVNGVEDDEELGEL
jgi:MFS family permease